MTSCIEIIKKNKPNRSVHSKQVPETTCLPTCHHHSASAPTFPHLHPGSVTLHCGLGIPVKGSPNVPPAQPGGNLCRQYLCKHGRGGRSKEGLGVGRRGSRPNDPQAWRSKGERARETGSRKLSGSFFFFFPKAVQNFSILFLLLFLEMKSQAEMTQGPASCFSPTWCLSR